MLLIYGASHDDIDSRRRPLANEPGEGGQHGRHAALDVAGPAPVKPALLDARRKGLNDHVVGGHRVLMCFEQQRPARARQVAVGDDVVAARGDGLAFVTNAQSAEKAFQVISDAMLVDMVALQRPSHRVNARQGDKVL